MYGIVLAIILIVGFAAFGAGAYLYWKAHQTGDIGVEKASRIVKEQAEQQKVRIELSAEQLEAIRSQWIKDPNRPAQLTFVVGNEEVGDMKVATCPYFGTTCCA